jgi:hypothetical protein
LTARISEQQAMALPAWNTAAGETSQRKPKAAGITTAAMWLIVKLTPAVEAMSAGSAIFWN